MIFKKSTGLLISILLILLIGTAGLGLVSFFSENIYLIRSDIKQVQAEYMAYSGIYYCLHTYLTDADASGQELAISGSKGFNCILQPEDNYLLILSTGYSEGGQVRREAIKRVLYEPFLF